MGGLTRAAKLGRRLAALAEVGWGGVYTPPTVAWALAVAVVLAAVVVVGAARWRRAQGADAELRGSEGARPSGSPLWNVPAAFVAPAVLQKEQCLACGK